MIEKKEDGVFTACGSESYKYRFARSMTMFVAIPGRWGGEEDKFENRWIVERSGMTTYEST